MTISTKITTSLITTLIVASFVMDIWCAFQTRTWSQTIILSFGLIGTLGLSFIFGLSSYNIHYGISRYVVRKEIVDKPYLLFAKSGAFLCYILLSVALLICASVMWASHKASTFYSIITPLLSVIFMVIGDCVSYDHKHHHGY